MDATFTLRDGLREAGVSEDDIQTQCAVFAVIASNNQFFGVFEKTPTELAEFLVEEVRALKEPIEEEDSSLGDIEGLPDWV